MTVTLAFKAFAKASPCLTPFLATSDPSVHKRILAYIWGSLARRTFFPKRVILATWPRPAVLRRTRRPGLLPMALPTATVGGRLSSHARKREQDRHQDHNHSRGQYHSVGKQTAHREPP